MRFIHIHHHTRVLFQDGQDMIKQCRCGHLEHYESDHPYNDNRTVEQSLAIREELISRFQNVEYA